MKYTLWRKYSPTECERFELSIQVKPVYMISNHAPSATRTTLHHFIIAINSGCQTRTDDNLINSQVLYQLSYAGITHGDFLPSQEAFL